MPYQLGDSLLETANSLLKICDNAGRPRETDLRRAVSTAYYAMFHILCDNIANMLVGGTGTDRSDKAWKQVYRALNHADAKRKCKRIYQPNKTYGFPDELKVFAAQFHDMQEARHNADYNPDCRLQKQDVRVSLEEVSIVIADFKNVSPKDRTAFAVWLLFNQRDTSS